MQTTFGLNLAGSQAIEIPDFVVPAQTTVYLMVRHRGVCRRLPAGAGRALHWLADRHPVVHVCRGFPHLGGAG
ncbi:MAG: hypothetical protein HND47_01150 [Chloroflexi bacterium]|nr:hypothetical protein [Chloroflexota bacterium]